MTLIIDTAPLVASADLDDPRRSTVQRIIREEQGARVIPCAITAEVDYLLGRRLGRLSRLGFLQDLASGRFAVECLDPDDYEVLAGLERTYADLDVGLADLSLVILARRYRTRRLLTFDARHFRAIRPLQGGAFTILPGDS